MPRKDQQARVAKPASACQATVAVRGFSAEAASGDRGGVSLVLHDDGFADVIMSRPTQFNTFNDALIKRFTEVFEALRDHNGTTNPQVPCCLYCVLTLLSLVGCCVQACVLCL